MSRTQTFLDLKRAAAKRAGVAGLENDEDLGRAVNEGIAWMWGLMVEGFEGYGQRKTFLTTTANSPRIDIQAGAGGPSVPDDGTATAIVRGVWRISGIWRPLSGDGESYAAASFMPQQSYFDRIAPASDESTLISRPGIYWFRQLEDGSIDELQIRPIPSTSTERLRMVYTAVAPLLAADTDTLDVANAYEDPILHHAAYKLLLPQDRQMALHHADAAKDSAKLKMQNYTGAKNRGIRRLNDYKRVGYGGALWPFGWR